MSILDLKFQTNSLTPPPFAHAIHFILDLKGNSCFVQMEVTYLDRETLTVDEIYEEGFSDNDDLKLKVILPKVWGNEIQKLLKQSEYITKRELEESDDFITLNNKYPKNASQWVQLVNEMRQAVVEKAEIEAPLLIEICRISKGTKSLYKFKGSFVELSFTANKNSEQTNYGWKDLNKFLRDIYSGDFLYEKSKGKLPNKDGIYIHLGDEYWLELGKSYLNQPSKVKNWLD